MVYLFAVSFSSSAASALVSIFSMAEPMMEESVLNIVDRLFFS